MELFTFDRATASRDRIIISTSSIASFASQSPTCLSTMRHACCLQLKRICGPFDSTSTIYQWPCNILTDAFGDFLLAPLCGAPSTFPSPHHLTDALPLPGFYRAIQTVTHGEARQAEHFIVACPFRPRAWPGLPASCCSLQPRSHKRTTGSTDILNASIQLSRCWVVMMLWSVLPRASIGISLLAGRHIANEHERSSRCTGSAACCEGELSLS